jgi:hypothetical protein
MQESQVFWSSFGLNKGNDYVIIITNQVVYSGTQEVILDLDGHASNNSRSTSRRWERLWRYKLHAFSDKLDKTSDELDDNGETFDDPTAKCGTYSAFACVYINSLRANLVASGRESNENIRRSCGR